MIKKLKHKYGERRIVKRFALLPVVTDDHHKVWLDTYFVEQYYNGDAWHAWVDTGWTSACIDFLWLDVEERCKL